MDLKSQIEQFFRDIKDVLQIIAPLMAFIGIVGAGIISYGRKIHTQLNHAARR